MCCKLVLGSLSPPWRSVCAASCCGRGGGTGTGHPALLVLDSLGWRPGMEDPAGLVLGLKQEGKE